MILVSSLQPQLNMLHFLYVTRQESWLLIFKMKDQFSSCYKVYNSWREALWRKHIWELFLDWHFQSPKKSIQRANLTNLIFQYLLSQNSCMYIWFLCGNTVMALQCTLINILSGFIWKVILLLSLQLWVESHRMANLEPGRFSMKSYRDWAERWEDTISM